MTLQSDNGGPSFYTFTAFRPGKIALLYGGLLTILSFCVVVFLFNYGIREKLWSFETVSYGSINPSPASASDSNQNPMQAERTIKRVALSDSTIHSLVGSYFSEKANHKYAITLEGDRLNLRVDAQTGMELIPVSDHSLYANQDLAIEFRAAHGGKVDQLDIYDRGRHFVAARQ